MSKKLKELPRKLELVPYQRGVPETEFDRQVLASFSGDPKVTLSTFDVATICKCSMADASTSLYVFYRLGAIRKLAENRYALVDRP